MKKFFKWLCILICLLLFLTFLANKKIESATKEFVFSDTNLLPSCKTAVLLGTSSRLKGGIANPFFYNRVDAATKLFNSGKIKAIIVSGDNSLSYYNEPAEMKKELIKAGVPDSVIYLDYAGFRTFDSMLRASEIFSQQKFIVVSQEFHNQRAVFIARHFGIEAYGYNAKDVGRNAGRKTNIREFFARLKVFIDIFTNEQPKFLGEKVVVK